MSIAEKEYTKTKARSLASMKDLASHSYSTPAKHLGCVRSPLISISLDHIVLDELHLLLRVMDVLIRNLILYMDNRDHKNKVHQGEVTVSSSWRITSDHVVSASRSGRIESQLGNLFLEVTTSLHFQGSTSCRCWKGFPVRWTCFCQKDWHHK